MHHLKHSGLIWLFFDSLYPINGNRWEFNKIWEEHLFYLNKRKFRRFYNKLTCVYLSQETIMKLEIWNEHEKFSENYYKVRNSKHIRSSAQISCALCIVFRRSVIYVQVNVKIDKILDILTKKIDVLYRFEKYSKAVCSLVLWRWVLIHSVIDYSKIWVE